MYVCVHMCGVGMCVVCVCVACLCVHVGSLLHGNRFAAAEQDCTAALSLDPTYTKALFRRATARTKLKKQKDAIHGMFAVFSLL